MDLALLKVSLKFRSFDGVYSWRTSTRSFHAALWRCINAQLAWMVAKSWRSTWLHVPGEMRTVNESSSLMGATLSMTTTADDNIRIHNVYNRNTEIDLDELAQHCMGDSDILVGDFNLAAGLWAINGKSDPMGEKLARLVHQHNMVCLNEPGVLTYSRSKDTTKNASVIDL